MLELPPYFPRGEIWGQSGCLPLACFPRVCALVPRSYLKAGNKPQHLAGFAVSAARCSAPLSLGSFPASARLLRTFACTYRACFYLFATFHSRLSLCPSTCSSSSFSSSSLGLRLPALLARRLGPCSLQFPVKGRMTTGGGRAAAEFRAPAFRLKLAAKRTAARFIWS